MSVAFAPQSESPLTSPTLAPAAAPIERAATPPGSGTGGLFDKVEHVASSSLGAVEHAASAAAGNLAHGVDEQHGPSLDSFWNHVFGGPSPRAGDGRPLTTNHIGTQKPGPVQEGGAISTAMRDTPYFGDYWESLSVTHDSLHLQNKALNGATSLTDVALPGPLMGLVDAPFRATGHSLFLDPRSLAGSTSGK